MIWKKSLCDFLPFFFGGVAGAGADAFSSAGVYSGATLCHIVASTSSRALLHLPTVAHLSGPAPWRRGTVNTLAGSRASLRRVRTILLSAPAERGSGSPKGWSEGRDLSLYFFFWRSFVYCSLGKCQVPLSYHTG
jgi:hypothetical protein